MEKRRKVEKEEGSDAVKLRFVGFCGVDESFNPPSTHIWPDFVEWGILFRPECEGKPRFPKQEWVKDFVKSHSHHHFAAHLCSSRLEEVLLAHNFDFVAHLFSLGFRRFQLNATGANGVNMELIHEAAASKELLTNLLKLSSTFSQAEFILQRNQETESLWQGFEDLDPDFVRDHGHSNISLLFDASVGQGKRISSFPTCEGKAILCGYAGGINPENVADILLAIPRQSSPVWIDMESGIRTKDDDACSWEKVQRVCDTVKEMVDRKQVHFQQV